MMRKSLNLNVIKMFRHQGISILYFNNNKTNKVISNIYIIAVPGIFLLTSSYHVPS